VLARLRTGLCPAETTVSWTAWPQFGCGPSTHLQTPAQDDLIDPTCELPSYGPNPSSATQASYLSGASRPRAVEVFWRIFEQSEDRLSRRNDLSTSRWRGFPLPLVASGPPLRVPSGLPKRSHDLALTRGNLVRLHHPGDPKDNTH
jgi:hypothetical protein